VCAFAELDDVSRKTLKKGAKSTRTIENAQFGAPAGIILANSRGVECHLTANNPTNAQDTEKPERDTTPVVAASKFGRMTVIWVTAFEMFLSFYES
jgi:hypothetical protein